MAQAQIVGRITLRSSLAGGHPFFRCRALLSVDIGKLYDMGVNALLMDICAGSNCSG